MARVRVHILTPAIFCSASGWRQGLGHTCRLGGCVVAIGYHVRFGVHNPCRGGLLADRPGTWHLVSTVSWLGGRGIGGYGLQKKVSASSMNKIRLTLLVPPTMARKAGRGERDRLAPRGRSQHHKTRRGRGRTCTLSLRPLLNWLWARFMLALTLCCSWEWFDVLLRGPESDATRRRGTTADGGRRSSGGWRVGNRGSWTVAMRGMSRRTNASRGARWAKA